MDDDFEDSIGRSDTDLEISHPDIDSALEMHLGSDDFSYTTRTMGDTTEHLVMQMRNNQWKVHLRIKDEEVKTLNDDEMATFLIHQISMQRALKRRLYGVILIFFLVAVPVVAFSVLVLGIEPTNDFEVFLIAGGVTVALLSVFCLMMSSAERSVDNSIYTIRPNLLDVFKKMMDSKDNPYQKRALEQRIQRLHGPAQSRID